MPYNRLSTAKIARAAGCHPNTVRLYEQIGFIASVPRSPKGYRLYTPAHQDQMCLARMGMQGGYPGRNIHRSIITIIRCSACAEYRAALDQARRHLDLVRSERRQAEAAADFLAGWARGTLRDDAQDDVLPGLRISQAARLLDLTPDALRNWERSGLITVPRLPSNRYRLYRSVEIGRLRVIRLLRQAGYSPMAILRMLLELDRAVIGSGELPTGAAIRQALDTPRPDEDVYTAADRWLTTLAEEERRAHALIALAEEMVSRYAS